MVPELKGGTVQGALYTLFSALWSRDRFQAIQTSSMPSVSKSCMVCTVDRPCARSPKQGLAASKSLMVFCVNTELAHIQAESQPVCKVAVSLQAISIPCESILADSAAMEPIWTQQEPILPSHAHAKPGPATQGGGRETKALSAAETCGARPGQSSSSPVLDLSVQ